MSKSPVYFTDFRTQFGLTQCDKLVKLIKKAGIEDLPLRDSFAAVKIHFGEPGNLAYLRPAYAASVVEVLSSRGARPYLTDCNTLYPGGRKNALEHLEAAYKNGFTPYSIGCQILIGDGLKGNDDVELPVPNGELLQKAYIGRAIADSDVLITLNHFKAHEMTGMGGALKNLGMGCGSRAGKKAMHNDGLTKVLQEYCVGCGRCTKACAHGAPHVEHGHASIDLTKCVGCGRCIGVCPHDAIMAIDGQANGLLDKKIAEYAAAVLNNRPSFHISLVRDVSPYCDCHSENDAAIVPDIGMFASFDPVALDQACSDAVLNAPVLPHTALEERRNAESPCNHFTSLFPETDWEIQLNHAVKLGLGTREYELIRI